MVDGLVVRKTCTMSGCNCERGTAVDELNCIKLQYIAFIKRRNLTIDPKSVANWRTLKDIVITSNLNVNSFTESIVTSVIEKSFVDELGKHHPLFQVLQKDYLYELKVLPNLDINQLEFFQSL